MYGTTYFSFFSITGWGIDLDYCDIEWFALETKRSFFILEIASNYCILDSFVDYDGYSISYKGFLPTVVDIPVIWILAGVLKWFAIAFSSGPHFVRTLHHDLSILGGPTWRGSYHWVRQGCGPLGWLVFCDCGFQSVCPLIEKDKRLMEASWWERLTEGGTGSYSDGRGHAQ